MKYLGLLLPILSSTALAQVPKVEGPLTLKQAAEIAARNSPVLRAASADIAGAHAGVRSAQSKAWPRVSANSFAATGNNPAIFPSAAGVDPSAQMLIPADRFFDQNLMLMVPVYTGGVIGNGIRAALAMERASKGDGRMVAAELTLRVRDAYLRALLTSQLADAEAARAASATEMVRVTKARFDAGKEIQASVQRSEAELSDAKRALATARNEGSKAVLDLKAEMGIDLDSSLTLADSLAYAEPAMTKTDAVKEGLASRGDVQSAGGRLRAAEFQLGVTNANSTPQVYGVAMGDAMSAGQGGSRGGLSFGLTLSVPLFDAGQRSAEREQSRATVEKARAELVQVQLMAAKEIEQAWLDIETGSENYRTALSALQAAQSAYDVVALRVSSGKGTLVDQLDALAALTRAKANLAQSLYDHQLALAKLDRAIGFAPPSAVTDTKRTEVAK